MKVPFDALAVGRVAPQELEPGDVARSEAPRAGMQLEDLAPVRRRSIEAPRHERLGPVRRHVEQARRQLREVPVSFRSAITVGAPSSVYPSPVAAGRR